MRNYYPARWNIHAIAESTDIVNRTKNALERFNRDLNESFTTAHPNLLVFMAVIKEKSKNYVVMLDDIRHHRQRAPEHGNLVGVEIPAEYHRFCAEQSQE
ncbi:hypothetical protein JG687_00019133 [Phytophthora cactorum]|nr:hypothetical protein PC117_g16119 [Phytophthora cactorum]KAG4045051.1 hypothetical protein PC123_g19535 [Phytophthora cactorum]KAG4232398.1 hypothetical protein PC116_g19351 [Phytophthora cactorum]KAG6942312.1 hypothetical protein JG687_00019133 [Phytophthora cactorum]RAW32116.1 hypothetical protein PC110_g11538 [Phytophthora cactorum]